MRGQFRNGTKLRESVSNILKAIVLTLCVVLAAGCGRSPDLVAKINNEAISVKDFNDRISKLPERYQSVVNANKRKFLDELIVDTLLYREALSRGLHKGEEVRAVIEEARKKILIAKLLKVSIDDSVEVDEREARGYYDRHSDEFRTPEALRASHILVKTEEEAAEILAILKRGRGFEDTAREKSFDPSAANGGDIGYFTGGQIDPDFEKVCLGMKVGDISGVVRTNFGYHVIKLTGHRPPSIEAFDDVKKRIERNLLTQKKKKSFNLLVERLKNSAEIDIYEGSLGMTGGEKNAAE